MKYKMRAARRGLWLGPIVFSLLACGGAGKSPGASKSASGSTENAAPTPAPPVQVQVATAHMRKAKEALEVDGTLRANREARIVPEVSGVVADVKVDRGDHVEIGQPLVVLRASSLKLSAQAASARADAQLAQLGLSKLPREVDPDTVASVAAAKAEWESTSDVLQRYGPLHAQGVIDDRTFEQAKTTAAAARSRYDSARQAVQANVASYLALRADAASKRRDAENSIVRAPFAGSVVQRLTELGESVGPQTPVVELVDTAQLRLELQIPERNSADVYEGQEVRLTVDSVGLQTSGTVRYIAAALDPVRRTLTVEAIVPNADGKLRAGHFARAQLQLDREEELIEVPREAVIERAGVSRVYVLVGDQATTRIVDVVGRGEATVRLIGDVPEGAKVVLLPPADLADGSTVAIQES